MAWQLDSAHSEIQFSVRHMMISKVRGTFDHFSGTIDLSEQHPEQAAVDVTIQVDSISTREGQRDGHLKSQDFFDVERYPTMRFVSTRVERTGDNTAKLHGDLTIRDQTRPIVLDVTYHGMAKSPWGTISAGFAATGTLDRTEWGLAWNQALETGGVLVGNQVNISIEAELIKQETSDTVAA